MFSKPLETIGLGVFAWGLSRAVSFSAGLMFAGAAIVLIGSVTDDKSVGMAIRRRTAWVRYAWRRQIARETGLPVPPLFSRRTSLIPCGCGGDELCPVCGGSGVVPDPTVRVGRRSPHPPIHIDPQAQANADRLARSRQERAKVYDRTPALSRIDYSDNGDDLERIG